MVWSQANHLEPFLRVPSQKGFFVFAVIAQWKRHDTLEGIARQRFKSSHGNMREVTYIVMG